MPASHKILIAEDDLPSAELLREVLEQMHYQVLEANDGAAAVELAGKEHPDLAIVDVMLPFLNGFEVCDKIRRNPELTTLPIIMLTVLNEPHHRIRASQAGATDFLTKPFNRLELLAKVRSLLGLQDAMSQREHFQDVTYCLLTSLGSRSPEAAAHSKRVARIAEQLGRRCGIAPAELKDLYTGALLHDAGKLALDGALPIASESLSPDALSIWQKHTVLGDLMFSRFSRPVVKAIIRSHHEQMDGTGFPDGLYGNQIPVPVRVVALCNRLDHLTGGRMEESAALKAAVPKLTEEAAAGRWDTEILAELEELSKLCTQVAK